MARSTTPQLEEDAPQLEEDAESQARLATELANDYAAGKLDADEYYAQMERLAQLAVKEELHEAAERRVEAAQPV